MGIGKQRLCRTKRAYRGVDERTLRTGPFPYASKSHALAFDL